MPRNRYSARAAALSTGWASGTCTAKAAEPSRPITGSSCSVMLELLQIGSAARPQQSACTTEVQYQRSSCIAEHTERHCFAQPCPAQREIDAAQYQGHDCGGGQYFQNLARRKHETEVETPDFEIGLCQQRLASHRHPGGSGDAETRQKQ